MCHARLSGNDFGCAATDRGRVCLRLVVDLDGCQRPGCFGQSHHRELGRGGVRLEPAEAAGSGRLGQDLVEVTISTTNLRTESQAPSSLTRALLLAAVTCWPRPCAHRQ